MQSPFTFYSPNTESLARGSAVNLLFRFGMRTAKAFPVATQIGNYGNPEFTEIEELLGKPWLSSLALEGEGKRFEFVECIITINQEKNIVTTPLQGADGTVKEYVSDGDYAISINAAVNNYTQTNIPNPILGTGIESTQSSFEYPEDQIKELVKLIQIKKELACQSDFLEIFKIKWLVIKSYDLQQETHSNRQSINIQALSDKPLTYFNTKEKYAEVK